MLGAAALAAMGGAVRADVLVSNLSEAVGAGSAAFTAQSFTTGNHTAGYVLWNVQIRLGAVIGRTTDVSVRKGTTSAPGMTASDFVANLATPDMVKSNEVYTFVGPSLFGALELEANTTYWVMMRYEAGETHHVHHSWTSSNSETGAAGWSIGDGRLFRNDEEDAWSTTGNSLLMAVNGKAKEADDATLRLLQLHGEIGETITITPSYDPDVENYTATVANGVKRLTLYTTETNPDATVTYLDGDGATLDDDPHEAGDQIRLAIGENTIQVKVTATDTVTTKTHTVVVTRQDRECTMDLTGRTVLWTANVTVGPFVQGEHTVSYGYFGDDAGSPAYIVNERGVGYRMVRPDPGALAGFPRGPERGPGSVPPREPAGSDLGVAGRGTRYRTCSTGTFPVTSSLGRR